MVIRVGIVGMDALAGYSAENRVKLQLTDLPIDVLHVILRKLNTIEALSSLVDVDHPRLNAALRTHLSTTTLDFVAVCADTNEIGPLPSAVLDRFCSSILPKIHPFVRSLHLERMTWKRILRAGRFPRLSRLHIANFHPSMMSPKLLGTKFTRILVVR